MALVSFPYCVDSVLGEIVIQLPRRDLRDVLLPFLSLRREKVIGDVLTKQVGDDSVLFQLVARFLEIVRQVIDSQSATLSGRYRRDAGIDRLARVGLCW